MKWFWEHGIHNINYMWHGSDLNLGLVIKDDGKVIYSRPPSTGDPRSYCDPEADYEARVNALETDEDIYIKSILQELKYRKDASIRRIVLNYKYFPEFFREFRENLESENFLYHNHPTIMVQGKILENNEIFKIEMDEGYNLIMNQTR